MGVLCFNKFYHPFYFMFDITSWTSMLNETVSKDTEILLPSLGLIKHIHDIISLLYYGHWTDKQKYIPYISVTQKVLKSCRSKMATLAYDVCDVHGASSLYIQTCPVGKVLFYMYMYNIYVYNVYVYIYIHTYIYIYYIYIYI